MRKSIALVVILISLVVAAASLAGNPQWNLAPQRQDRTADRYDIGAVFVIIAAQPNYSRSKTPSPPNFGYTFFLKYEVQIVDESGNVVASESGDVADLELGEEVMDKASEFVEAVREKCRKQFLAPEE